MNGNHLLPINENNMNEKKHKQKKQNVKETMRLDGERKKSQ